MESLPLGVRLKRRAHRDVALAQDLLVAQAFDSFPECVLHGGTAIWRCFGGTRFSEDVDAYVPGYSREAAARFGSGLAAKGVKELKFKETENTVFAGFEFAGAPVSFEGALRRPPARVAVPYETLAGGRMLVAALPPEELVLEKASAYAARRKVRDLYDTFFLLGTVGRDPRIVRSLRSMSEGYRPPMDEAQLKAVVLAGAVPSAEEMIEGIRRWGRRST